MQKNYIDLNAQQHLSNWRTEVKKINQCTQRQDSTDAQLRDLVAIANKLGFYDAADYLQNSVLR